MFWEIRSSTRCIAAKVHCIFAEIALYFDHFNLKNAIMRYDISTGCVLFYFWHHCGKFFECCSTQIQYRFRGAGEVDVFIVREESVVV